MRNLQTELRHCWCCHRASRPNAAAFRRSHNSSIFSHWPQFDTRNQVCEDPTATTISLQEFRKIFPFSAKGHKNSHRTNHKQDRQVKNDGTQGMLKNSRGAPHHWKEPLSYANRSHHSTANPNRTVFLISKSAGLRPSTCTAPVSTSVPSRGPSAVSQADSR